VGNEFPWKFEPLAAHHDRSSFDCGNADLDNFLKLFSRQNEKHSISRTLVAVRPDDAKVAGYYSMSAGHINCADLPPLEAKRLPGYPVPIALLGRLAVDRSVQKQGLGQGLLVRSLEKAFRVSEEIGIYAVAVFSIDEAARAFYLHNGFKELLDHRMHLFMNMKTIRKLCVGE
jgi:GNAT superfamily N-acetyltransferase